MSYGLLVRLVSCMTLTSPPELAGGVSTYKRIHSPHGGSGCLGLSCDPLDQLAFVFRSHHEQAPASDHG
jgi:hypothetical protein